MKELTNSLNLDLLPKNMRDIVDVVGLQALLKIVDKYGGTRVFIPMRMNSDHPLSRLIGVKAANKLWKVYQGEHVMIDKCESALLYLRDQEIFNKLKTEKRSEVAREYGLTETRIYQIQSKFMKKEDQLKLL